MKHFQSIILAGITALLSGCACECEDDNFSTINIQFEGFSETELRTIYVVNPAAPDPCPSCFVLTGNSAGLLAIPNTQYQLKSDSIPLNKIIQIKEIRTETTKDFACECTNVTGIDYEFDGNNYTNEPIVITK